MSLFGSEKEKPDLLKDAPRKKGLALGFSTVWRELFSLITLNFLFLLFLLPLAAAFLAFVNSWPVLIIIAGLLLTVFTLPAALAAMSRITAAMVRDENYFLWHDFRRAFRQNYAKALAGGMILFTGLALFTLAAFVYYQIFGSNMVLLVLIVSFAACLILITLTAGFYFWPMLAFVDLPLRALLKNSLLLVMGCWKRSLLALLVFFLASFVIVGLYPGSMFVSALIAFSLTSLCLNFAVWPGIEEKVLRKEERASRPAATGLHSAEALVWEEDPDMQPASLEQLDFGPEKEE